MITKNINSPSGKTYEEITVPGIVYDDEPIEGSFNGITSDAVAKIAGGVADLDSIVPEGASEENKLATAADVAGVQEDVDTIEGKIPSDTSTTNKLVNESGLQDAIDNASESWSTGFTPKGESSVSDLNDLDTQSNGDSYIVTDSGTLTDGSLAVVAGDQVAWDATNSVWYKLPQYAPKRYGTDEIHNLSQEATSFASGDFIAVSNTTDGARKMSKDTLLELTAQNALAGNVAPAFDPTKPNDAGGYAYYKDEIVAYNGATYKFKVNHSSGAWNAAEVDSYIFSSIVGRFSVITNDDYALAIVDTNGVFLFGIRHDGSVSFQKGVPEPINRKFIQVAESIESLENNPDEFYLTSIDDKVTIKDLASSILSYGVVWVNPNRISFASQKTIYVISSFVDLNGSSVEIPSDCILMFFGGCLSNGTIVGDNTKIVYSPKIFGDTLTISGTWDVDFICSDMLQSPFGTNSLRKLNALMSDDCFNEVVIRPGTYYFEPDADGSALLSMASNTKLRIDGRIEVVPNGFPHNYVIYLNTKHHIDVFGSGTIHGDADEHDYITTTSTHEWCHAFQSMQGCHHVSIKGLNIENFPGDAACLSGDNLSISNLTIDHCGRQGLSLEMCSNVIVSNCKISDIYRTAPKAAVDIEPWVSGSRASNIKLVGLDISKCTGILFINSDCVSIENINAKDCTRLFYGSGAKDISIKNVISSKSGATPNDYIDVKNSCERVFADCLAIADEQSGSIDAANVRLGLSCFYNSDFMKPTSAAAGSVSYESGKYIQFNGTSWVNMDGTNP